LSGAEQADERHVPGQSCRYCFPIAALLMAESIARRQTAIRKAVTPLPGSVARDYFKPVNVPGKGEGLTLLDVVCQMVPNVSRADWAEEFVSGLVVDMSGEVVKPERIVLGGESYRHKVLGVIEPEVNGLVEVLHEEEAFIIVNKPAPLPMHEGGRFYRNTLQHILNEAYQPQKPLLVHRLDANTTGLVVVARTKYFAAQLQAQFVKQVVKKVYLVRVQGMPVDDVFFCDAPIGVEVRESCIRKVDWEKGLSARTEFRVVQRNADNTTLLEARPLTGRTNQIRVHLWHLGFPIVGDRAYLPRGETGTTQTSSVEDSPMFLHAWQLAFENPVTREQVVFRAPVPAGWGRDREELMRGLKEN